MNHQPSLFNQPNLRPSSGFTSGGGGGGMPRASRRTDPATSHEAEKRITATGQRQTHGQRVLECIRQNQGLTYTEIALHIDMNAVEVMRRLGDLQRLGLACKHGKKDGRSQWWPVNSGGSGDIIAGGGA